MENPINRNGVNNFGQEFSEIIDYNNELWSRFLFICNREIRNSTSLNHDKNELVQSLDLIKAINSYRSYKEPEKLLKAFPRFSRQKEYIKLIWKHFDTLSQEELSDLSIEMIHEISNCSVKLS